ncbi:MAG: hypothetical protein IKA70_03725 [Alistipes sp.]|nr:hypothetical protein [Alistipes sp.]
MKRLNYLALLLGAFALAACSTVEPTEDVATSEKRSEVAIGLPIAIASRTSMDEAGHARWSDNDKIALWADNSVGASVLKGEVFSLCYYMSEYNHAIFTSRITPLAAESYNYYAVYPVPQSIENLYTAKYTIPSTQQGGDFNGDYDIMVAEPATGDALTSGNINKLDLMFNHKMHTLKISIPEGGNALGYPIKRLEIEFPTAVAGTVAVDVRNAAAAPTLLSGANNLTLTLTEGITEGDTIYATIAPGTMTGTVRYRAYADEGRISKQGTFEVDKFFTEGHITPVRIKIPSIDAKTTLRFSIGENRLGEAIEKITIYDHNGAQVGSFTANAANAYDIVRDGEFSATGLAAYQGKTFRAVLESANAIVEQRFVMPNTIAQYMMTRVTPIVVPYLFEEDFTSIHTSFEKDDERKANLMSADGMLLNDYMSVSGWNAAHVKGVAGQSVRVNVRHQSTFGVTRSNGRLDSPSMKRLKAGANVKLKVTFDMGAYVNSGYGSNNDMFCIAGVHTNDEGRALGGIVSTKAFGNVSDDVSRVSGQFSSIGLQTGYLPTNFGNDSFGSTFPTYSYTVSGCSPVTRLCWIPCCTQTEVITSENAHYYIYIDNIKVSIAQ